MNKLAFIVKEISKGGSVTRAYQNLRLRNEILRGEVIDVGGGRSSDYLSYMKRDDDVNFRTFDAKAGDEIDFEKDSLPALDGSYDTVLCLNVMEHIYNHQHFASELVRIVNPENGRLIGFVPFLMWYHADYSDFFRYTHEALEKIFWAVGAKEIVVEEVGGGPFVAASQMILLSFPKILRVPVFVSFWLLDVLYQVIKGKNSRVYQLGYYFEVSK